MQISDVFNDTKYFEPYSLEHLLGVLSVLLIGIWFLYMGK